VEAIREGWGAAMRVYRRRGVERRRGAGGWRWRFTWPGFSYTPETWALAQKPEDRRDAARQYIEAAGGKLHGFWYAFGEYDAYNLWEAPDNVSMAAVAMAISGGGALSKYETTVLLTVEETMDAMARARDIGYRPPGA
jgi:uncharacterized protein with GYD domain